MTDNLPPPAPPTPALDQPEGLVPSAKPAVQPKPAPKSVTQVWKRKAGAFGRNPVPTD